MDFQWPLLMASPDGGSGGGMFTMIWFGLIILLMYFLMIHPQRKKKKQHDLRLEQLKKGDRVVTTGGMFGTVFAIDDKNGKIVIRINENTKLEFLKSSIAARVDD